MRSKLRNALVATLVVTALIGTACSSSSDNASPSSSVATTDAPATTVEDTSSPSSEAPSGSDDAQADYCATVEQIAADVGSDALEVDELEDHPDRYESFKQNLTTLNGLMDRLADVAPDDIRDATRTVADAVRDFDAAAQKTGSAQELVAVDPDFDSGAIGNAADAVEDYAEVNCAVDLDLD